MDGGRTQSQRRRLKDRHTVFLRRFNHLKQISRILRLQGATKVRYGKTTWDQDRGNGDFEFWGELSSHCG